MVFRVELIVFENEGDDQTAAVVLSVITNTSSQTLTSGKLLTREMENETVSTFTRNQLIV